MNTKDPEAFEKRRAYARERMLMRVLPAILIAELQEKFGVSKTQAVKDVKWIQKQWQALSEQDEKDTKAANVATAEALLGMAMKEENIREGRQCLDLLCKLQGSYPEKVGMGTANELLRLAGQAAQGLLEEPRATEVIPPSQIPAPPPPPPPSPPDPGPAVTADGAREDPALPLPKARDRLPTALRVSQGDMEAAAQLDPAEVKALAEGRVNADGVTVTKAPSGATRVARGGS